MARDDLQAVEVVRKAAPHILANEEGRLADMCAFTARLLLRWMDEHEKAPAPSVQPEPLALAQIDTLSRSFPLCMAQFHSRLRTEHHLKHAGRLLYVLFLKGAGMSVQDTGRLLLGEFKKRLSADVIARKRYMCVCPW